MDRQQEKETLLKRLEDIKFEEVLEMDIKEHDCESLLFWHKMAGENLDVEAYKEALWWFVNSQPSRIHYGRAPKSNPLMKHCKKCDDDLTRLRNIVKNMLCHKGFGSILQDLNLALALYTQSEYNDLHRHPIDCRCVWCD